VNTPNNGQILVAIASDGAGSASYSHIGSKLACQIIMKQIQDYFEKGNDISDIKKGNAIEWIEKFLFEMEQISGKEDIDIREYACTLIVAILGEEREIYFQIGDGAIIVMSGNSTLEYNWVFWPDKGEYENTTHFTTERESLSENLKFEAGHFKIIKLAVFTDGIQRLALHYKSQTVYEPFFNPLFDYVKSQENNNIEIINEALASFLGSKRINEKTDDDKTLILAIRL
jgi:hypothetical protein